MSGGEHAAELDRPAKHGQGRPTNEQLAKAEEQFRARLESGEDARSWTGLGRILRQQGRLVEARGAFERAMELDPAHLAAYLGLAGILVELDQTEQAFDILSKGTTQAQGLREEGVSKASVFFFLGEMQLQLHELAEALGFFHQAGEEAPDDAKLQERIGDALQGAGHLAESEAFYLRAMELDPQPAHTYNRLGIARRKQGKYAEAVETFIKATRFHPRDENLLFNLGRCLYEKGDLNAAERLLARLIKMAPGLAEAALLAKAVEKAKAKDESTPDEAGGRQDKKEAALVSGGKVG